jgi:hypothetical protein
MSFLLVLVLASGYVSGQESGKAEPLGFEYVVANLRPFFVIGDVSTKRVLPGPGGKPAFSTSCAPYSPLDYRSYEGYAPCAASSGDCIEEYTLNFINPQDPSIPVVSFNGTSCNFAVTRYAGKYNLEGRQCWNGLMTLTLDDAPVPTKLRIFLTSPAEAPASRDTCAARVP